jgi:hypothetical protein
MAVKGVPLDLSRKLKTREGLKVSSIRPVKDTDRVYNLVANIIGSDGSLFAVDYTEEGFYLDSRTPDIHDLTYDDEILNNEENKTMRLEVYQESQKEKETVRLRLVQHEDKGISLCAVDKDGIRIERGTLLTIRNDGSLSRDGFLNEELGFKLNERGQIDID